MSSFSRTSLILSSVSFGETGRFRGTAGHEGPMTKFQRLKDTGNLNMVRSFTGFLKTVKETQKMTIKSSIHSDLRLASVFMVQILKSKGLFWSHFKKLDELGGEPASVARAVLPVYSFPQTKRRTESHVPKQLDLCSCSDRVPGRAGRCFRHMHRAHRKQQLVLWGHSRFPRQGESSWSDPT